MSSFRYARVLVLRRRKKTARCSQCGHRCGGRYDQRTCRARDLSAGGFRIYVQFERCPYTSPGTDVSNYRIISIPLELTAKSVGQVFDELGPLDDTKWRVSSFQNGTNVELNLSSTIEPGQGYWFITKGLDNFIYPVRTRTRSTRIARRPGLCPHSRFSVA